MNSYAHDPQGVILRVPENNILAASPTDVAVRNYAPAFNPNDPGALTITDNLLDVATRSGGLRSPDYLLQNIRRHPYYNEVVVCGRPNVPLPQGLTGIMTVVGLFMLTNANGEIKGGPPTRQARELRVKACARELRVKACAREHHLPVLYIPNSDASLGSNRLPSAQDPDQCREPHFVDSSGLGMIVGLLVSAKKSDCKLRFINLTPRVREIFTMTRLLEALEAHAPQEGPFFQ